jgi:hypothetical protein
VTRARHPAGSPEGGRFAPSACASVYAVLDALAEQTEPAEGEVIADEGNRVVLHVRWCPHGHTRRWADRIAPGCKQQRNCRGCHPPRRGRGV